MNYRYKKRLEEEVQNKVIISERWGDARQIASAIWCSEGYI